MKISGKCPDGRGGHAACIVKGSAKDSQKQGLKSSDWRIRGRLYGIA